MTSWGACPSPDLEGLSFQDGGETLTDYEVSDSSQGIMAPKAENSLGSLSTMKRHGSSPLINTRSQNPTQTNIQRNSKLWDRNHFFSVPHHLRLDDTDEIISENEVVLVERSVLTAEPKPNR